MRRLRVLAVVSDLHFGGGENRILNIATAIDKTRFDYRVATLYRPDEQMAVQFGDMRDDFERAGIQITHLNFPRPRPARFRMLQVARTTATLARVIGLLRQLLIDMRPDIVDAHLETAALTAIPAALLARIPVAITLYGPTCLGFPQQSVLNATICRAGALISDSRKRAEQLAESSGRGWRQVYVVPNGVRLPAPTRSRPDMFAALDLPETTGVIIGQIAAVVPSKGYDTLIDAAASFLSAHRDSVLLCVGYPRDCSGYIDEVKRRVSQLGIARQVRFVSWPGNIADIWSIVDVHVHASHFDSLPNAIVEGMSLGRPAVVTSVGGIPELVSDEETGLVVAPHDSPGLAEAVLRMLNDERLRVRLGTAAKQRYIQRCMPEVTTPMLQQIFCTLAGATASLQVAAETTAV